MCTVSQVLSFKLGIYCWSGLWRVCIISVCRDRRMGKILKGDRWMEQSCKCGKEVGIVRMLISAWGIYICCFLCLELPTLLINTATLPLSHHTDSYLFCVLFFACIYFFWEAFLQIPSKSMYVYLISNFNFWL